jgi:hypothetical protein
VAKRAKGVELPPTIELLLAEVRTTFESPVELLNYLVKRGLVRELYARAAYTRTKWQYENQPPIHRGTLRLCPAGALNPFDSWGKCFDPGCTATMATRFAQTIGLYADDIVVIDPVTSLVRRFDPDSPGQRARLNASLVALRTLEPLLRAGIIRFGVDPILCDKCDESMNSFVSAKVPRTTKYLKEGFRYDLHERNGEFLLGVYLTTDKFVWRQLIPGPVAHRLQKTAVPKTPTRYESIVLTPFVQDYADTLERTIMRAAISTVRSNGLFATADAIIERLWRASEGTKAVGEARLDLEKLQTVDLPFVKDLTVDETLILRDRAAKALPSFRARIDASLGGPHTRANVASAVKELRAQALDVRAELGALGTGQRWRAQLVTGSVGLAIGVLAADPPVAVAATALGSALAAIGLMHPHTANAKKEVAKLKTLPGFVFVVAEDLLRHAAT